MGVVGGPHAGLFLRVLKNGEELGLIHIEYAFQETEGGIADALKLAENFAGGESICVILGDNCTDADISREVQEFTQGATIFLKEVPDPARYGVPRFNPEGSIAEIIEKPPIPPSNLAVTGLYLYDQTVFEKIRQLRPSGRGELEITDLNNAYLEECKLKSSHLEGFWSDAGTFESLAEVGNYWRAKSLENQGQTGKERI